MKEYVLVVLISLYGQPEPEKYHLRYDSMFECETEQFKLHRDLAEYQRELMLIAPVGGRVNTTCVVIEGRELNS